MKVEVESMQVAMSREGALYWLKPIVGINQIANMLRWHLCLFRILPLTYIDLSLKT